MSGSTRSFLLGFLVGGAAVAVTAWAMRSPPLRNAFSRLTGYTVEQGTVVTRARFAVWQDGVRVGILDKGVRLDLKGNTDKMTRFTVEIAWPETGPREEYFAPPDDRLSAFLEIEKAE